MNDIELGERIAARLAAAVPGGARLVRVSVEAGVVHLSGCLDSLRRRNDIEAAVWSTPGVCASVTSLTIPRTAAVGGGNHRSDRREPDDPHVDGKRDGDPVETRPSRPVALPPWASHRGMERPVETARRRRRDEAFDRAVPADTVAGKRHAWPRTS